MPVKGKFFSPEDPVYEDLFRESTRRYRRALLIVSSVALIVLFGDIFPTGVPALGVQFGSGDRRMILWCVVAMLGYLLCQFHVRARMDISKHFQATFRFGMAQVGLSLKGVEEFDVTERMAEFMKSVMSTKTQPLWKQLVAFWHSDMHMKAQVLLDFVLPEVLGGLALVGLVGKLWSLD